MKHGKHRRLGRDGMVLVVLVVVSAGVMALDRASPDSRIVGQVATIFSPFESLSSTVMDLSYIRKENRLLRAKLMDEARQNDLLREEFRETARLHRLLDFEEAYPGTLCACRVVRELGGRMGGGIILDKGAASGIERNMTVIAPEGLVGRVVDVARDACHVRRLVDPGYRVSARVLRSRASGIVGTQTEGKTVMEWVSPGAAIEVGDTILTSGLGSATPKGIMVGTVTEVQRMEKKFSLSVKVEPFVDFGRLEEVFLILRRPPDYGTLLGTGED